MNPRKLDNSKSLFSGLFGLLLLLFGVTANADESSWMEDNLYRFRNNDLTVLSLPASHDAGLYKHDIRRLEIGVNNLHASLSLSGPLVPDRSYGFSETGIVEAGYLLDLFDGLLGVVHVIDSLCVPFPGDFSFCLDDYVDVEGTVWGWVGEYYDFAVGKPGELSITQNLNLYDQLSSGIRRFDLRPKKQRGNLYIHHSQPNIEGIGRSVNWSRTLEVYVPCVGIPGIYCVDGTGKNREIGTVSFSAGGEIRSVSSTGPSIDEVLADVRRYFEEGHREFVILDFKKYWAGYQGQDFSAQDYDYLVEKIETTLSPWLLTEDMLAANEELSLEQRLLGSRLPDLVGSDGRILVNLSVDPDEYPYVYTDPTRGLWPDDVINGYGTYTNTEDLETMMEHPEKGQRARWMRAHESQFQLWWTLTCQADNFDCSVRDLAAKANPELPGFVNSLEIPNPNGNNINEIWVDFSEESAATEIAISLNPIAAVLDIKPGNDRNSINPLSQGNIWVAIVADPDGLEDPLQIDLSTLAFGPGKAEPNRFKSSDVNGDGLSDLLLRFGVPDVGLTCGDESAIISGRTYLDQRFIGVDVIRPVGCQSVSHPILNDSSARGAPRKYAR